MSNQLTKKEIRLIKKAMLPKNRQLKKRIKEWRQDYEDLVGGDYDTRTVEGEAYFLFQEVLKRL